MTFDVDDNNCLLLGIFALSLSLHFPVRVLCSLAPFRLTNTQNIHIIEALRVNSSEFNSFRAVQSPIVIGTMMGMVYFFASKHKHCDRNMLSNRKLKLKWERRCTEFSMFFFSVFFCRCFARFAIVWLVPSPGTDRAALNGTDENVREKWKSTHVHTHTLACVFGQRERNSRILFVFTFDFYASSSHFAGWISISTLFNLTLGIFPRQKKTRRNCCGCGCCCSCYCCCC